MTINPKKLGGSDAGPIMLHTPRHPVDVWLRILHGTQDEQWNFYMALGSWAEEQGGGRRRFEESHGVTVRKPDTIEVPGKPLRYSPDGIVVEWGDLWEFKFRHPGMRKHYGEAGTDEIPDSEMLQVQFYMHMLDLERCWHTVQFYGPEQHVFRVERNKELGQRIEQEMLAWYDRHIVRGEMPSVEGYEHVNKLWPTTVEGVVEASPDLEMQMRLLGHLKATIKRGEEVKAAIEGRIKDALKDHTHLQGQALEMTWKRNRPSKVTDYAKAWQELLNAIQFRASPGLHPHDVLTQRFASLLTDAQEIIERHTTDKPGNRPLLGPKELKLLKEK